jgi:molybdopterin-guanine dinucleotide biosynthesis protein A
MLGIIILAGGRSSRFVQNKALVYLGKKTLIQHIIEKVYNLTHEIIVVIPKDDDLNSYSSILESKITILKDIKGGIGPLEGMLIGLKTLCSEFTLVLPCDSPFLNPEVFRYLQNFTQHSNAVIPKWPNGYIEPLHAIYKVKPTIIAIETTIKQKNHSIFSMIQLLKNVAYINTNRISKIDRKLITFFNVNTQKDLEKAKKILLKLEGNV